MNNKDKLVGLLKNAKYPLFDGYPSEIKLGNQISSLALDHIAESLIRSGVTVDNSCYFVEGCSKVDGCMNILNWYRNLYYKEGMNTEQGIIANAINDMFMKAKSLGVLDKLNEENIEI